VLLGAATIAWPVAGATTVAAANPQTTPPIGTQLAELKCPNTVTVDVFGGSVAISGTTAIVGARLAGRAYVFAKAASGWKQAAELKGSGTVAGDWFGASVAISGTTAIVGADLQAKYAGRAFVFTRTASGWHQAAALRGSDTVSYDAFGGSVAISGTTAVVGASGHANRPGSPYAGRAYVFTKTASGWHQTAELKGSDTVADDEFGSSVAISGTTVIVGAPFHAHGVGRAYVFTKTASGWHQIAELKSSDAAGDDYFGWSVAVSGTIAVVDSTVHSVGSAGRAYVFTKTAAGWHQTAELKDAIFLDGFGQSVAISGTTAVVGAPGHADAAGRAYVFTKTASGWHQIADLKGSDTVADDEFGLSVAVSGSTAAVGAPFHANSAGRAYLFEA